MQYEFTESQSWLELNLRYASSGLVPLMAEPHKNSKEEKENILINHNQDTHIFLSEVISTLF